MRVYRCQWVGDERTGAAGGADRERGIDANGVVVGGLHQ